MNEKAEQDARDAAAALDLWSRDFAAGILVGVLLTGLGFWACLEPLR